MPPGSGNVWQRWLPQARPTTAPTALPTVRPGGTRWQPGLLEGFVAVQLLSSGLLLVPGTQPLRFAIRAFPYLLSLALWFWRDRHASLASWPSARRGATAAGTRPLPVAARWMTGALVVLALEMAHPETPLIAGAAQLVFQLCIAAPLFWASRARVDPRRLETLVWLMLGCYGLGSVVGLAQVYHPDVFLPRDFSSLLGEDYLGSLSFEGAAGQTLFRPPGLTDLPGGAATAGAATAFLGLSLVGRRGLRPALRVLCIGLVCAGLFVLYLCQVRSLLVMLVAAVLCETAVNLWRGRIGAGAGALALLALTTAGVFFWAVRVGGDTVSDRFLGLAESGMFEGFQQERAGFFAATFNTYLPRYPLGAGLGRWGMMSTYFGGLSSIEPLYVEVQLTGWLFDGGVVLWVLIIGAILAALVSAGRLALFHPDEHVAGAARVVLCLNLLVVGQSFAGPVFNTQLGILFWFLTGALHAAATSSPVTGRPFSPPPLPAAKRPPMPTLTPTTWPSFSPRPPAS